MVNGVKELFSKVRVRYMAATAVRYGAENNNIPLKIILSLKHINTFFKK